MHKLKLHISLISGSQESLLSRQSSLRSEHCRLVSSLSVFSDTTSLADSQIYADLSSSFISESRASSSLDTTSSVFSESVDTASTVFSDSGSEFMDSISEYQLSGDNISYSILPGAPGSVTSANQQHNELAHRRQYYLTHSATSPKPYLHDSFNIPPCMTHSVDFVNDTAKVVNDVAPVSPSAIYYSQSSLPAEKLEQRKLRHSVSATESNPTDQNDIHCNTLPRRGKSKTCMFESHGKLSDTNTRSLDLLDEALSKCNVEEFSNSNSQVITTSTRDLGTVPSIQSSTCSVGSLHNSSTQTLLNNTPRGGASPVHKCDSNNAIPNDSIAVTMPTTSQPYLEEYIDPVCHNCTKHSSVVSSGASMSVLQHTGRPSQQHQIVTTSTSRGPHHHHTNNLQSQYSVSMCQVSPQQSTSTGVSGALPAEFTHSRTEVNGLGLTQGHNEASFLNPNLPLQYVDLGRFDGKAADDWTHSASQPRSSSTEGYPQARSSSMEAYVQPRASSMEGYDQVRSANVEGYNPINGSVTTLPPSGRNGQSMLPPGGDNRSGSRSGGLSPSQQRQEYQQELILEKARQQAQLDLQHSYVNLGAALPRNMSSKVRNHYVNVSIHHQNLNHYVNMTEELKSARKDSEAATTGGGSGSNKDWRKYMLAYHNSLKRPRSADSRTRGVSNTSPGRDSAPTMTRSRGKSLDNIFSGSHFDVVMPIQVNDVNNGNGSDTPKSSPHIGPKSPQRSISVDSAHSSSDSGSSNKLSPRPALPPRNKKPPVSLPISKVQSTTSPQHQQGNTVTTTIKRTRPATAPALGRLVMSPSSPAGSRSSSGAHTPVSPCARSPPIQTGASNSDYMMMQGFPREDSHSPIFCAVELPRRNASFSSYGTRSRNCSFSSATSTEDQVSYVDMSLGHSSRGSPSKENKLKNKARLARGAAIDLPPKPKLMQSRSLDNELEENYLRMDVGSMSSTTPRTTNEDYMCMSPSGDETQLVASSGDELDDNRSNSSGGGITGKSGAAPFDNLIEHLPYTNRKKVHVPKSKSVDSGSSTPSLPEPASSQSKQRFLSRLIRRNSSKGDRKSTKGTNDECLSPPNEPAIPEGITTDMQSNSRSGAADPFGLGPAQGQQHRKASWDDRQGISHGYEYPNVGVPKKGRSMSYCTGMPPPPGLPHGLPHQGSNLTDEEKQQSSSLMSRMGLSPPNQSSVGSENQGAFVPALPTKSTEAFDPPKMVDSPAYMLVVPGQIPTTMTNSEHKFMSKSDIVGYAEHDYCEPDLPPTLPRKTGKRRKSRDVILTSPTSILSGSSRSSSNDRNLSSPASADLLYATDDGKASSTSSSAATSPRSVPRNQDNWLLVNIPAAQQPDHVHGNGTEDVWVQQSTVTTHGKNFFLRFWNTLQ